nr:PREDICTED: store-operated calcium entry regulator STIMATE-like [Lepisosteus oculatus]
MADSGLGRMVSRPGEEAVLGAVLPASSPHNTSLSASPTPGSDSRGCENGALMDSFGIFLQGLLGVVAFSTLMLKRFREPKHERRPWRIW